MSDAKARFLPGATIGVMGGGQLGRMFAVAARRMGYKVRIFTPDADSPGGQLSDFQTTADFADEQAVREFARSVDVLTFEFENIPFASAQWAAEHAVSRPAGTILHTTQNRRREKTYLAHADLPLPRFAVVRDETECAAAIEKLGRPCVVKSADFGYDGKGQRKVLPGDAVAEVWRLFEGSEAVVEEWVDFVCELSVIVARGIDGAISTFPATRNTHSNHILDISSVPFGDEKVEHEARQLAMGVADAIDLRGLLAVEMFYTNDGRLLINELAPRTHNSGHWTLDACATSQFEQQVRAVCGLPLGSTALLSPCAMANLLGEVWAAGEPDWHAAIGGDIKLHLYGKTHARIGRKMGHLTALAATAFEAIGKAEKARAVLARL